MRRFARTVDKRFLCNRRRFYRANSNRHKQRLRVSLGFVDTHAVKVKIGKCISARSIACSAVAGTNHTIDGGLTWVTILGRPACGAKFGERHIVRPGQTKPYRK
jgi:hypothetical protein